MPISDQAREYYTQDLGFGDVAFSVRVRGKGGGHSQREQFFFDDRCVRLVFLVPLLARRSVISWSTLSAYFLVYPASY